MSRFRYCFLDDEVIYVEYDGVKDILFSVESYLPLGILDVQGQNRLNLERLFVTNERYLETDEPLDIKALLVYQKLN
jgi:hypothetical protein